MSPSHFRVAVRERAGEIRQLMSAVTPEHPRFGIWDNPEDGGWVTVPEGRNLTTRIGSVRFSVQEILNAEAAALRIAEYKFTLTSAVSGHEVFAYHLHTGRFPKPHLHLGAGAGSLAEPLYKAHFPTGGPVELSELLRLLIEDLGVRPLRADWERVLAETPAGRG